MYLQDGIGTWAEKIEQTDFTGRPALFLDRDGVVVEEVDFLHRAEDIQLTPGIAPAIAQANALGVAVVIVTNQSGIARGRFGWAEFQSVQDALIARLTDAGAHVAAVFACGYHGIGKGTLGIADHPWRKPAPGMLVAAAEMLHVDLPSSWIIGDRVSDLEAGFRAGLPGGTLVVSGYGRGQTDLFEQARQKWLGRYTGLLQETAAQAITDRLDGLRDER
ncbi:haloacid dehalogenase [Aureimonas sp. SA4125]|uniref:D-glycero-alpha-D-manno-heptose-1,7-bisphosphate 7-phosphatase n=1 Tax=Aureimonas sp. SA4125 TaxID=2826993 RepID=UPI001CC60D3B|nr:HAD-IIIA family hydrolase [Aureimonas sp. SA4125]BDA83913.1 haloacid dehalogenase [Aureimonas sp. SA4125]